MKAAIVVTAIVATAIVATAIVVTAIALTAIALTARLKNLVSIVAVESQESVADTTSNFRQNSV